MRRINKLWKLYLFYTGVLVVTMTIGGFVLLGQLKKTLEDHLVSDVLLLGRALEANLPLTTESAILDPRCDAFQTATGVRVTMVRKDGAVVCESEPASVDIQNHLDRPEVQDGLRAGTGRAIRRSKTLGIDMLYVAIWVKERDLVLRMAMPMARVKMIENQVMTFMALALYLTPFLSALIAYFFARYIIQDGKGPTGGFLGGRIGAQIQ
jgi:two-component system, OmpR family, phosphate regulon sensor histidine kinase PhoR